MAGGGGGGGGGPGGPGRGGPLGRGGGVRRPPGRIEAFRRLLRGELDPATDSSLAPQLGPVFGLLFVRKRVAEALGIAVNTFSIWIYISASLFTASAVSEAGAIGFVGLVIPHLLRLISGSDHRSLLPGAVLAGGSLLMLAAILYLGYSYARLSGGTPSFDYFELQRIQFPRHVQVWRWAGFAISFFIQVPMFPLHTRLRDAHTLAPTAGTITRVSA